MVAKQKKRKYCETPTRSERFCLLRHTLLPLTLHWPQKVTGTWICHISPGKGSPTMFMKGRNGRYLENITNCRLMGESTDGMSKCLVHSRSRIHASSLQRNVPIFLEHFPPSCLFFLSRGLLPQKLLSLRTQRGRDLDRTPQAGEVIPRILSEDFLIISHPEYIKTAAEVAAELVFTCMAFTMCQALL